MNLKSDYLKNNDFISDVELSYHQYIQSGYTGEEATTQIFDDFSLDEFDEEYLELSISIILVQLKTKELDYSLREKTLELIELKLTSENNESLLKFKKILQDYNKNTLN